MNLHQLVVLAYYSTSSREDLSTGKLQRHNSRNAEVGSTRSICELRHRMREMCRNEAREEAVHIERAKSN